MILCPEPGNREWRPQWRCATLPANAVKRILLTLLSSLVLFTFRCSVLSDEPRPAPPVSFEVNDKFGYKDAEGKVVIEPEYDNAREFSCGLAAVNLGAKWDHGPGPSRRSGGKWGFIDEKGKVTIPLKLEWADSFSEGFALVGSDKGDQFIDTSGRSVLTLKREQGGAKFSEGLATVRVDLSTEGKDFLTTVIDTKGHAVFTIEGYVGPFHESLATFSIKKPKAKGRTEGYIDRSGKVVITPQFAEAEDFHEGLAAVRPVKTGGFYGKGDAWGYIDKTGRFVLKPQFNETDEFRNGVARVHTGGKLEMITTHQPPQGKGGEWQLSDRKGQVLKRSAESLEYEDAPKPPAEPKKEP